MKIKLGQCKCGAMTYLSEEAGMKWVGEMEPLDAQEATQALLAGRELYRIQFLGPVPSRLSTAKPAVLAALLGEPGERPFVVKSHGCPSNAVRAVLPASQQGGGPGAPKAYGSPSVAPSRPSSGVPRSSATVPTADRCPSDDQAVKIIQDLLGATVLPG